MKRLLGAVFFIIVCICCITGCKTRVEYVTIYPELPEYSITFPEKEELTEIPTDATIDQILDISIQNLIKLTSYSNQLEEYSKALLEYYNSLRQFNHQE